MKAPAPRHQSLNYDTNAVGDETGLECTDPSLTVQSEEPDSNINVIVKRIMQGQPPPQVRTPTYGDFTGINDFQTAMDAVNRARDEFMKLPPELRARLNNDPQEFLEFVDDPDNLKELQRLGLVKAEEPPPEAPKEASKGETTEKA